MRQLLISVLCLLSALSLADESAKITSLRINLSAHEGTSIGLQYGIRSTLKRIKKPVVAVIFVAENPEGKRKFVPCFTGLRPTEEDGLFAIGCTSIVEDGLTAKDFAQRRSAQQAEVDVAKLQSVTIVGRRLFLDGSLEKMRWKVLWARAEVWVDGKSVGVYETPETQSARKKGTLPEDWQVANKHPDKFDYFK